MSYVAAHKRPLLVPDLSRDRNFALLERRPYYRTNSFMVIPLTGQKFWGVINLADRQDDGAREEAPAPHQDHVRDELEGGGDLEERHHHLHRVQPPARARQARDPLRHQREDEEREREDRREREHADQRPLPVAARRGDLLRKRPRACFELGAHRRN